MEICRNRPAQTATFKLRRFTNFLPNLHSCLSSSFRASQDSNPHASDIPNTWLQFQNQHQLVLPGSTVYDRYVATLCRKIKVARKQWGRWIALPYKKTRSEVSDIRSALSELVAQKDITGILRKPSLEKRFGNLSLISGIEVGARGKPSADFFLGRFEPFSPEETPSEEGLVGKFAIVAEIEVKSTSYLARALHDALDQFDRRQTFWDEDGIIIYPKNTGYRRYQTYFDTRAKIHRWLFLPHTTLPKWGKRIDGIYVIPLSLGVETFTEASRRIAREIFTRDASIPTNAPTIDEMKKILSAAKAKEALIGFWPVGDLDLARAQLSILKPSIDNGDMTILDVGDHVLGIAGSWAKQQDLRKW